GADSVRVDASGDLVIKTGDQEIRQLRPVIYQEANGARQQVSGGYQVRKDGLVGFQIGNYDRELPLRIDPVLAPFLTYLGGSLAEIGWGITVSPFDNSIYVVGETLSKNAFPATPGAFQTTFAGGTRLFGDAFVAKYTSAGLLSYLTYLGGKRDDCALDVAVDAGGNAYITGFTDSLNFPITTNAVRNFLTGKTNNALRIPPVDAFV